MPTGYPRGLGENHQEPDDKVDESGRGQMLQPGQRYSDIIQSECEDLRGYLGIGFSGGVFRCVGMFTFPFFGYRLNW
jgi:hypothetical protein